MNRGVGLNTNSTSCIVGVAVGPQLLSSTMLQLPLKNITEPEREDANINAALQELWAPNFDLLGVEFKAILLLGQSNDVSLSLANRITFEVQVYELSPTFNLGSEEHHRRGVSISIILEERFRSYHKHSYIPYAIQINSPGLNFDQLQGLDLFQIPQPPKFEITANIRIPMDRIMHSDTGNMHACTDINLLRDPPMNEQVHRHSDGAQQQCFEGRSRSQTMITYSAYVVVFTIDRVSRPRSSTVRSRHAGLAPRTLLVFMLARKYFSIHVACQVDPLLVSLTLLPYRFCRAL